ncbi:MAG: 3-mercaptopyruvate sulfurtransferase [Gemmatimonadota bacterium]|nr:3-mercaptopyruvate sulfurtransferase [Gemmatimonadota bacterium]
MTKLSLKPLVSTAWLGERLGAPGLVLLDASWYLPTAGRDARAEFQAAHLPGARWFDLDAASDHTSQLPHMLPPPAEFAAYVAGLGVSHDSTVVVYDGSGNNLTAARVWWMFRLFGHEQVAVLDGGLGKWRAEGRPLEHGPVRTVPGRFTARCEDPPVRTMAQVEVALARETAQVVDLRAAGRFEGREPEPRPGLPSGHMKGAINLPFSDLVAADGTGLPLDVLRARIRQAGIALDRPIIATCGSGTSACNLVLALARLGEGEVAVYDGSWTEWAGTGRPIARSGEHP